MYQEEIEFIFSFTEDPEVMNRLMASEKAALHFAQAIAGEAWRLYYNASAKGKGNPWIAVMDSDIGNRIESESFIGLLSKIDIDRLITGRLKLDEMRQKKGEERDE